MAHPPDHNRAFRALLVLVLALGLGTLTAPTAGADSAHKLMFGGFPGGSNDGRIPALNTMEQQAGRQLDYVRDFEVWDSPFPTAFHNTVLNSSRILFISVWNKTLSGTRIPWASIATAQPGSAIYNQMQSWVDRLKATGHPIWFVFNHEPEASSNQLSGTNTDYIAAWQHFVTMFRDSGATNVKFVWTMTDWSFAVPQSDRRYAPLWYPGDAYVDMIAADAYNWTSCRTGNVSAWRSLQQIVSPLRDFGAVHPSKPLLLAEWASSTQGGDKANWINQVDSLFQQPGWGQFVGISYFNAKDANYPNCNFPVNSDSGSMAAFRSLAQDPQFNGADGTPAPPPPPSVVLSGTADSSGATGARWQSTQYTTTAGGIHTFTLSWSGLGNLRIEVVKADGTWVGANSSTAMPKTLSVRLTAGAWYRIAVWSVSGAGTFTVTE